MEEGFLQHEKELRTAARRIVAAGVVGIFCGLFCLLLTWENLAKSSSKDFSFMERQFLLWAGEYLVAGLAVLVLSLGTFRKSRWCAVLLLTGTVAALIIFPLSLIFLAPRLEGDPLPIVAVGVALSLPFYLGVRGAFAYRRLTELPPLTESAGGDGAAAN